MRKKRASKSRWVHLGNVAVDTGQILIIDPCRIGDIDSWNEAADGSGFTFSGGVVTDTGMGDGVYPIHAEIIDMGASIGKRVARVVIDFSIPPKS